MTETQNASNDTERSETTVDAAQRHTGNAASAVDAKLSGPLAPLEAALDGVFGEKASFQLPKDIKELLVKIAPWLALLSGIFGIYTAYNMWRVAHFVNEWTDSINRTYGNYGLRAPSSVVDLGLVFYISIATMIVFAILALLAFPGLKAKKKIGWNLMFYSMIASVAYGIVSLFYSGGGVGSLLSAVIGSVIGMYILFQVRSHYKA